ncbi:hypothetical protein BD289DRAFT_135758 [Coniella lustricola]|uniref:Uncharacterized protein n=1 Tax=Coniella lustricola TaxID=2025994 RepID=A0A2T3AFF8_9PEZI|nr:hypothetical protein BD289DRAFT_135758 [Coniella lustricola]
MPSIQPFCRRRSTPVSSVLPLSATTSANRASCRSACPPMAPSMVSRQSGTMSKKDLKTSASSIDNSPDPRWPPQPTLDVVCGGGREPQTHPFPFLRYQHALRPQSRGVRGTNDTMCPGLVTKPSALAPHCCPRSTPTCSFFSLRLRMPNETV